MNTTATKYLQTKEFASTLAANFLDSNDPASKQLLLQSCFPKDCIKDSIDTCILQYRDYIEQLISLFIKNFAEGFSQQKGAIFGFGPDAEKDTGDLLKISAVTETEMNKLDKVPVHTGSQFE